MPKHGGPIKLQNNFGRLRRFRSPPQSYICVKIVLKSSNTLIATGSNMRNLSISILRIHVFQRNYHAAVIPLYYIIIYSNNYLLTLHVRVTKWSIALEKQNHYEYVNITNNVNEQLRSFMHINYAHACIKYFLKEMIYIFHSSRIKSNHIYPFRSDIPCHTSLFLQDILGNLFCSDTYKSCYSRRIGCYKSSRLSTTISIAKVYALVSNVRRTLNTSALSGTR